jgi:hypothetical protein
MFTWCILGQILSITVVCTPEEISGSDSGKVLFLWLYSKTLEPRLWANDRHLRLDHLASR